jgi:hypothetical protein
MKQIRVEQSYQTGLPNNSLPTVIRRVSALTRRDKVSKFKIGITCNPLERARKYIGKYKRMVVLYKTNSRQNVAFMEKNLISYNWDFCENLVAGGGGRLSEPPYFLYIVL